MKYSVYEKAKNEVLKRKSSAEKKAEIMHNAFVKKCPEARLIERKIQSSSAMAGKMVLSGSDVRETLSKLKEINLGLQEELQRLMHENGYNQDDLEPKYSCKACNDTGFVDGYMCECLKSLAKRISYEELNSQAPLEISGFENINPRYYEAFGENEKTLMERNLNFCKNYAETFSLTSPSLLFYGATGLGKTHFSLAIAKSAIEKNFGVVYGSIQNFAMNIERERFDDNRHTFDSLVDCELLILDDFGTEFSSDYTKSMIYDLINSRILKRLPTIISTNLGHDALFKRYGERIISRFFGSYRTLQFVGKDIRKIKSLN